MKGTPFDQGKDHQQFIGLAGIGKGQHHVFFGNHPQVAVTGLAGVDEKSGTAGTGQGRRHLAADMAGLAHAQHHDAALAGQHQFTGLGEIGIDALAQGGHGPGLDLDDRGAQFPEARVVIRGRF